MTNALVKELQLRKNYLNGEPIDSIYFGGGTPSLLEATELEKLFTTITKNFALSEEPEITLEANPDDLSAEKLKDLRLLGINRLSIGIQTFDEGRLKYINRAHTKKEAIHSLERAQAAGFENITADLIYAIPPDELDYWQRDLQQILSFNLPHLSIYGLTIEEKTVFGKWAKKGNLQEVDEGMSARQYQLAMDWLTDHGYEHYEVSNFARPGWYSRHNSAYWENQKYLGIGPGAHSYDGNDRTFNVSNNALYIKALNEETLPLTVEKLTLTDRANEYLFTRLRTKKGIETEFLSRHFGYDLEKDHKQLIDQYLNENLMERNGSRLSLTRRGFLVADEISLRLFYDDQ